MVKLKTIGTFVTTTALSLTLLGCSSSPNVESDAEGSSSMEQEKDSPSSSSKSVDDSDSSSSSTPSSSSSSHKSYDDDDDGYSSSSSSDKSSDRRQTYAHTDPDGWSYMEYNDGSAEITDGWGMVARDTDGDGELDKISTDSGESWEDFE